MADPILVPALGDELLDGNSANIQFYTWMEAITEAVNNTPPLSGSGSPEGVETASVGRWYVDTSAAAGTGIYYKETGDGDTGWVARS